MMRSFAIVVIVSLMGCRETSPHKTSSDPPTDCTKMGATCTVSPGKLGSCVEVDQRTTGPQKFVCQSQH